jgi:hypothetical protein
MLLKYNIKKHAFHFSNQQISDASMKKMYSKQLNRQKLKLADYRKNLMSHSQNVAKKACKT